MSDSMSYRVGQRLSFNNSLCTVRYVGPIQETEGVWLGVEWDDPSAGKHSGYHNGSKYFDCLSDSPHAASFVRPKRPTDRSTGFLEALKRKYQSHELENAAELVIVGGKVAQEIGFEKIKTAQAKLYSLEVVLLNRQFIAGVRSFPLETNITLSDYHHRCNEIQECCPRVRQLDLSYNLFTSIFDVATICQGLPILKSLVLNGNRFSTVSIPPHILRISDDTFGHVCELSLDNTMLAWDDVVDITTHFPVLRSLSLAANNMRVLSRSLSCDRLKVLCLAHNNLVSLDSLQILCALPHLENLSLRGNRLTNLVSSLLFRQVITLDLSANSISDIGWLNDLSQSFPSLLDLRLSDNPFSNESSLEEVRMLSIAQAPSISILNFSPVSDREREDAELYYLSRIAAELGNVAGDRDTEVLGHHPLWNHLCRKYGKPAVPSTTGNKQNPGTLKSRMIQIDLNLEDIGLDVESTWISVPKSMNIFMLKSMIGDRYGICPITFKLLWETKEWNPMGKKKAKQMRQARFDVNDLFVGDALDIADIGQVPGGIWVKRETELVEGTSSVGFWIENDKATIKVEGLLTR